MAVAVGADVGNGTAVGSARKITADSTAAAIVASASGVGAGVRSAPPPHPVRLIHINMKNDNRIICSIKPS